MEHGTAERSFRATLDALPNVLEFVTGAAAAGRVPAEQLGRLTLAVEEAVANVCNHAYEGRGGWMLVRVSTAADRTIVEIEDEGRLFDPTTRAVPELSHDLVDRHPGGLGIELLRRMVDEVTYQRQGDRNVLNLVVRGR